MRIIKCLILSLLCLVFTSEIYALPPPLTTHEITEIHPEGILINAPGTYVFKNDIVWHPTGPGAAILIQANDVILDLKHFTLASEITSFNTIGIQAIGATNLTIKNGTIADMAYRGIECDECAYLLIKHIIIDGLNLENVLDYTVPVGIFVNDSAGVLIKKCKVKNIDVKTGSTAAIQLTETLSSKISHCHVKNLLNRDGACTGIGHFLCDVAEVKKCTLDGLESQFINNFNTEGHTTIGIVPFGTTNLLIKKCKVSNIIGCCDDAHGMSLFECLDVVVKDCEVANVLDGAGAAQTGAKATGIEVYASGAKVIGCFVRNITAINPQDKQATGFSCAECDEVQFIGCLAENVQVFDENGGQSSLLGYGTGFGWAPDPRPEFIFPAVDVLYDHCTAKKCQVGFDSWFHIDSVWDHIWSIDNEIPVLNLTDSQRTISCNGCSECGCSLTPPTVVTIDNVASNNTFLHVKVK